jgi:hypothetical protein
MGVEEEIQSLVRTVDKSIDNWTKTLTYIKAQTDPAKQALLTPDSPLNLREMVPRIETWLDKARAAKDANTSWDLRAVANTARNAWRPIASAVQSSGPTLTRVAAQGQSALATGRAALPAIESLAPSLESAAPSIQSVIPSIRSLLPTGQQVVNQVRQNPATVPIAIAAGRAAVAGGARGILGGWVGVAIAATVAVAVTVGVWAWTNSGSSSSAPQDVSAGPSPAPVREPEPVPPPVENLLGPGGATDPGGNDPLPPTPNAEPRPVPGQQSGSPSPQGQAAPAPSPQPQPPPPPPPTPQCQYPSSIGVSGGDVSSLGPQGGSFTATGPVTLSTPGLVNCGQHYQLGYSTGAGSSGYDCKTSGFNFGLSNVNAGDSVSVNFNLPPNSCG